MSKFGDISFNPAYLDTVKWTDFKRKYKRLGKDDIEVYLVFRDLTGRKVAGMERKLSGV